MNQPFFGGSPFIGMGDKSLGVKIPQILPNINSPQKLIELLAVAQKISGSGLDIAALIAKADLVDLCESQLKEAAEVNVNLTNKLNELESRLDSLLLNFINMSTAITFPENFQLYDSDKRSADDIQGMLVEVSRVDINEMGFHYIADGNTAVIRMNDGERIITVVAQDFWESLQDLDSEGNVVIKPNGSR